ncbi:MAG: hypothetical protein Q8M76_18380, partial [Spirochaetaceae bacterium]|nr:hypothetical protein [Spirochaetaceae bacterium]
VSANLLGIATDLAAIPEVVGKWNGVDLVLLYYHPDLGALAVNPKNPKAMSTIDRLNRSELLVVYAGRFAKEGDAALQAAAAQAVVDICSGREPKVKPELLSGECAYKPPRSKDEFKKEKAAPKATAAPAAAAVPGAAPKRGKNASAAAPAVVVAPPPAPKAAVQAERAIKPGARMTPMYSVIVSNELFHNGNVEAWKRIIQSYNAKHPDLEVLVYYDGERITNLNALFKWGKVKHGSTIQFAIAGEEISDVAKLQRYLVQGASRMYEAFLKGPVNSVMALF